MIDRQMASVVLENSPLEILRRTRLVAKKKCPHCAMPIPRVASICPHCMKRLGWTTGAKVKVGLAVIGSVLFLALYGSFVSNKNVNRHSSSISDSTSMSVGEKGRLFSGAELVPVPVSKEVLKEWTKARRINDEYGQLDLVAEGLILTPEAGTRVLIIDTDLFIKKVRILEGKYQGGSGWVPDEYIRK
jgi:hypothetical protein